MKNNSCHHSLLIAEFQLVCATAARRLNTAVSMELETWVFKSGDEEVNIRVYIADYQKRSMRFDTFSEAYEYLDSVSRKEATNDS